MKDPLEALAAARAAAGSSASGEEDGAPERESPAASARRLAAWAIIEPEQAEVYSTRRLGQPITWFKRMLIRLMSQYLGQISAQQSRFNANIAAHVVRLEERVETLERAAREHDEQPPPRS